MFTLFAHAGHHHRAMVDNGIDHCMPIIIGCGIVIAILLGIIVFLLKTWQPKVARSVVDKKVKKK